MQKGALNPAIGHAWRHMGLVVRGAWRHQEQANWTSRHHSHWQLLACSTGNLTAVGATGDRRLSVGSLLLSPPDMALQLQPSHDNVTIEVQFSVFCAGHGQPPWAALPMPWLVADCDATSLAHLPGLMNRWRWRDDHTAMEARFVVNRLLWQMAHADDIPTTNADHPRPPQWLRDAITAADAKLKDPDFRVSGLARLAGVSENYLNRVVRQCYGRTAQALLRQMRIHRAQHMLEQNPEQSSKAIAARCGFSSTRQLRDAWQAETGSGLRQARQAAQGIISP